MKKLKTIEYNAAHDSHGHKNVRWVENVSRGLRNVGFADEIIERLRHKGWFTEDDGDNGEVYRGIVYQLPSHGEGECYVYGYADPCNDDCALLVFDIVGDKTEAARNADRFAEVCAEEQRDYNRAWQAGRRAEDLAEEVKTMRRDALAIAEEMRAARKANIAAPTICEVLRGKIFALYRQIQKARKERSELFDSYGRQPGWEG
jgi:hypothetical protein